MNVDDCFQLGAIVKTHGFKGEVVLHLDVDDPSEYRNLESMFLEQSGTLVPFFIEKSQLQGDKLRITFEDVADELTAKELVGASAYLPVEFLPELPGDEYYLHQVVGFIVLQGEDTLGEVFEIYDQGPNPLFGFKMGEHDVLIPFQDQFIQKVDKSKGEIHVNLPEGYLDIYLEK